MEKVGEIQKRCNNLIKNRITNNFHDLKNRLLKFQELQTYYKIAFQKSLVSVLPAIQSGTQENKALGDILNNHYTSPFTATNMNKGLADIKLLYLIAPILNIFNQSPIRDQGIKEKTTMLQT